MIDLMHTGKVPKERVEAIVREVFDLRPAAIIEYLDLLNPVFKNTAAYGHFGRTPRIVNKTFRDGSGNIEKLDVELFTWEKLDYVDKFKTAFGL